MILTQFTLNSGCLVHDDEMCFECHHDNLCGGVSRKDCETMKIGDVEKLLKVVIKKIGKKTLREIYIYIYILVGF